MVSVALVAGLGFAALSSPSAPAAKRSPRAPKLTIALPSAGHISVTALRVTLRARRGRTLPRRRLAFRAPRARSLPPSVRLLSLTRSVRTRRSVRHLALVLAIRKKRAAASGAVAAQNEGKRGFVALSFETGLSGVTECRGCEDLSRDLGPTGFCRGCTEGAEIQATLDADKERSRDLFELVKQLEDDWPAKAAQDPSLDTGHYDDGHAFGWKVRGERAEAKVMVDLVADLKAFEDERTLRAALQHLEANIGVDVDGDGSVGVEQTIDTEVGPVEIGP